MRLSGDNTFFFFLYDSEKYTVVLQCFFFFGVAQKLFNRSSLFYPSQSKNGQARLGYREGDSRSRRNTIILPQGTEIICVEQLRGEREEGRERAWKGSLARSGPRSGWLAPGGGGMTVTDGVAVVG